MTQIIRRSIDDVSPEDRPFMHFTTWYPDTCGCVHEFFWDKRTSEDERAHHPHKTKKVCEHHIHHQDGDAHDHYVEVCNENWHKNQSIYHVLECLGDEHKIELEHEGDYEGPKSKWFKKVPHWSFDYKTSNKTRDLHLKVHNASEDDKVKIATVLKMNWPERTVHLLQVRR